jgi:tetratricopeptide (TPR) repeat protein
MLYEAASGQTKNILIIIQDSEGRPAAEISVCAKIASSCSLPTDRSGRTQLVLPPEAVEGSGLDLYTPLSSHYMLTESHHNVPVQRDFIELLVVRKGNRNALKNPQVARAALKQAISQTASQLAAGADQSEALAHAKTMLAANWHIKPKDLDRGIALLQETAFATVDQAEVALFQGRYETAAAMAEMVLRDSKSEDERANALAILATVAMANNKWEEAESLYRRAYEIKPNDTCIVVNFSSVLITLGRMHEAANLMKSNLSALENASGSDVESIYETLIVLGLAESANGNRIESIEIFERANKLSSSIEGAPAAFAPCLLAAFRMDSNNAEQLAKNGQRILTAFP